MILERPFLLFVFPAVFLAIGLTIASFNVSLPPPNITDAPLNELATIQNNSGVVELSRYHTSYSSPLPEGKGLEISLYNFDKVQTRLASKTQLSFLDGFLLEFKPKSLLVIEQWDPEENQGPIYINLLAGDYKVLKKGQPGSLFIVQKGQVFDPLRKPKSHPRALALNIQQPLETEVSSKPSLPTETDASIAHVLPKTPLIQTLSNEYIDETIAKNRDQFVKCQQYAIRENKQAKGQLLIGIAIEPLGKMKETRVLASDIDNPELHKCIQAVMNRTQFRPFHGPEIVRSYPLVFE